MKKQHSPKQAIRKRSFLLFELMVSMALLGLCLFPLIHLQARIRLQEKQQLDQIQLAYLSQNAFCLLKEKLLEGGLITVKQLKSGCEGDLARFEVRVNLNDTKTMRCSYALSLLDECHKEDPPLKGMVIDVALTFNPGNYLFQRTLYLESL